MLIRYDCNAWVTSKYQNIRISEYRNIGISEYLFYIIHETLIIQSTKDTFFNNPHYAIISILNDCPAPLVINLISIIQNTYFMFYLRVQNTFIVS